MIPHHKKTSHKGQNGEVLIIGGSEPYVGCLALAGLAALRTGIDWISIAAPEKVAWAISCISPDLITIKCPGRSLTMDNFQQIMDLANQHDVILIGMGMGKTPETKALINALVKNIRKPLVIDSDAIKAISLDDVDNAILTPHHKEFEQLLLNTGISEKDLGERLRNNTLLQKGPVDYILSNGKRYANHTGNEGMTKGGTGDVLAGLVAGFLAQGLSPEQSCINAAFINGKIGDYLKEKKGYSFIASDLIKDYAAIVSKL